MEKLKYKTSINADAATVYRTMLNRKTYSEWTSVFNPTSYFEGTWEPGEKILFIGTDENGDIAGMVSRIRENTANKIVSIEHLGIYKNGKEILSGPEVSKWAGAIEEYSFVEKEGKTTVMVTIDSIEEFRQFFSETWPKALQKLKEICERQ